MMLGLSATDYTSLVNTLQSVYCPSCPPGMAAAQMQAESSGNPNALNASSGAVGLFQLLPSTAADLGVNPNDPTQNIEGGLKYDQQMYNQFGNWNDALVAYNEGPGTLSSGTVYPGAQTYASGILTTSGNSASSSSSDSSGSSSADSGDDSSGGSSDTVGSGVSTGLIVAGVALLGLLFWVSA